ncbi:E3 ubiquitin-protein ligase TRAIP-like [Homarus americanus]|uniref:E3 ubiquitin-protein ligase TRAIP-like n=1 Tax=Homarus americanus TaxID=6706 RepID=UPI001C45A04A|nr:E3 ubiquitin-protein ligase TRAIP-like [Homarus americanus]XP_042232533.1 E3 ubiquitin-protein ligase TRAIP-like [Homarus americanus]XP_042232534.1 E3 ubiquitin-protein ligase TRAIP-like [Homarus americanus]
MRAGCAICGDLFVPTEDISATPCGHTFHSICIIQWIERSKSCPQCRHKATLKSLVKLFFDSCGVDTSQVDPATLQQQIDGLKFQIRLKEQETKNLNESNEKLTTQQRAIREEYKTIESQLHTKETTILALKTQLKFMDRITKEAQKAKEEAKNLRGQLKDLQNVEGLVAGTVKDVEEMMESYAGNPDSTRSLATFCSILKKELNKTVDDKKRFRDEASSLRSKVKEARSMYNNAVTELNVLQQVNKNLQDDLMFVEKANTSLKKKVNTLEQAISSPSGDAMNSALHRLIAESPAPAELKRPHTTCSGSDDSFITPEVVRKVARCETASESDVVGKALCLEFSPPSSTLLHSSQAKPKLSLVGRRPLAVTTNTDRSTNGHQVNIFAKAKPDECLRMSQKPKSSARLGTDQIGYDGLGGHHKVDVFPKPKPTFLKKKKGIKVVTKGGTGNRVQSTTLKDFLHNTFDD